jgi:hypothetical protein
LTRQFVATWLDLARGNIAVNHSLGLPCIVTPHVSVQGMLRSAHEENGPSAEYGFKLSKNPADR